MTALDPQELDGDARLRATALIAAKDALYPSVRVDWQPTCADLTAGLVDLAEYVVHGAVPIGLEKFGEVLRNLLDEQLTDDDEPSTVDPWADEQTHVCPECHAGNHRDCLGRCPCEDVSH